MNYQADLYTPEKNVQQQTAFFKDGREQQSMDRFLQILNAMIPALKKYFKEQIRKETLLGNIQPSAVDQQELISEFYLRIFELADQFPKEDAKQPQWLKEQAHSLLQDKLTGLKERTANISYEDVVDNWFRDLLINFYQKLTKEVLSGDDVPFTNSFVKLCQKADVESLFLSFIPYLNSLSPPGMDVLKIKLNEAIYTLLTNVKGIESVLFDFASPWKIDILDFMNNNFMYDLSLNELASYTGRSISAFKRDFKEISQLTPQRWIIKKRLEAIHFELCGGKKISEIYQNYGFTSLSHFSTAYKKEYGISPSRNATTIKAS
ncbi:MAG TPA: AraC family transcriptional regulator [Bacteroidetes bacterium]|nr:AraC family transcriptional regulator [Bacteroidota bacterium]